MSQGTPATRSTRAAVRYRDGSIILREMLPDDAKTLRRAGFCAYPMRLEQDGGSAIESDLWAQDAPGLNEYLNAAYLVFDDEPGSLWWEALDSPR